MKKSILTIIFLLQSFFANGSTLIEGIREGGGGKYLAAEFMTFGREAVRVLSQGDSSLDFDAIMLAVSDVNTSKIDNYCLIDPLGEEPEDCRDASYEPKHNTIFVVEDSWNKAGCSMSFMISAHELLRVAGLEGNDYRYSGRFLTQKFLRCKELSTVDEINKCHAKQIELITEVNYLCRRLMDVRGERTHYKL